MRRDTWLLPLLCTSLLRQAHHLNLQALAIKGPSPTTLNVFRSYKVLPLESITSFSDLRRKKKKKKKVKKRKGRLRRRRRGANREEKKGAGGIYGDKMPGSGRVCGSGIDQRGKQRTRGPNPDP